MPSGSRPLAPRRLLPGLAILLLASGALACTDTEAQPPAPPPEREYRISQDPEVEVLRIQSMTWKGAHYTVYGDGRLVASWPNERTIQLPAHQLNDLVRRLVDGGIFDLDLVEFREEIKAIPRVYWPACGDGGMKLTVNLDLYEGPSQSLGPKHFEIRMSHPSFLLMNAPDDERLQSLASVIQQVYASARREPIAKPSL